VSGSYAILNWAAITRIGIQFKTLAKAIGGSVNCFWDISRRGGIGVGFTVTGATSAAPGTFNELATLDRSTTSGYAYGIIRTLGTGLYGVQGPLTFGSTSSGDGYFTDTDAVVSFEARGIGNDKYSITVLGNSTGRTAFSLTNCIISSSGPYVTCNFSSTYIKSLILSRCTFKALGNAISFANDSFASSSHSITNCIFDKCGQINPGLVTFTGNAINNTTDANGGLLIDADGTAAMSNLSFLSDGTGHAIYITAAGSYTFTNFTYSGYGATASTDAVVYNNSGGLVTISVSGGDTPTYKNGTSATTTIVNTKTMTITVVNVGNTVIAGAQVYVQKASPTAYTAGAGNTAGDADLVITQTPDSDTPTSGTLTIFDVSLNAVQNYRYSSFDSSTKTFTFRTEVTYNCTGGGTGTGLEDSVHDFTVIDILEGDTIRNTTDGSWAVVDAIVNAHSIATTPLQGGSDNTWTNGDTYSVHKLATTLVSGTDKVDIPYINTYTNGSGIATASIHSPSTTTVNIRVRHEDGATKYIPVDTSGTLTGSGMTSTVVIQPDTVFA
jgi:hypothetical protein